MAKPNIAEMLFKNTHAARDCVRMEKLYVEYSRAKAKNDARRAERLRKDMVDLLPDALAGIQRIANLYEKAKAEMEDDSLYSPGDAASLVGMAKTLETKMLVIKMEVMP